jgi:hypothetical protein
MGIFLLKRSAKLPSVPDRVVKNVGLATLSDRVQTRAGEHGVSAPGTLRQARNFLVDGVNIHLSRDVLRR